MKATELADALKSQFEGLLKGPIEFRGELTLELIDPHRIQEVCQHAKQALAFDYLVDLSSVDHLGQEPRFSVVYHLYGYGHHVHLRLKAYVPEEDPTLPTVTSVWRTADWHEREAYDMMGIHFTGHPDLRRILMWEGYPFHPLRKDFPLEGKETELPEVAFTHPAPLEGGPFVTQPGVHGAGHREPRSRGNGPSTSDPSA